MALPIDGTQPVLPAKTGAVVIGQTTGTEEEKMKYVISWFERPQGSPIEYENAQKRILEVAPCVCI
jgi:hypothetical protein